MLRPPPKTSVPAVAGVSANRRRAAFFAICIAETFLRLEKEIGMKVVQLMPRAVRFRVAEFGRAFIEALRAAA